LKKNKKNKKKRERLEYIEKEKLPPLNLGGFMVDPPSTCPYASQFKRRYIVDMTICNFLCISPCARYTAHQSTFGKNKKEKK